MNNRNLVIDGKPWAIKDSSGNEYWAISCYRTAMINGAEYKHKMVVAIYSMGVDHLIDNIFDTKSSYLNYMIMTPKMFNKEFTYMHDEPLDCSDAEIIEMLDNLSDIGPALIHPNELSQLVDVNVDEINLINSGQKLMAIKNLKERLGIGLRETKDMVDAYCDRIKPTYQQTQLSQPSSDRMRRLYNSL